MRLFLQIFSILFLSQAAISQTLPSGRYKNENPVSLGSAQFYQYLDINSDVCQSGGAEFLIDQDNSTVARPQKIEACIGADSIETHSSQVCKGYLVGPAYLPGTRLSFFNQTCLGNQVEVPVELSRKTQMISEFLTHTDSFYFNNVLRAYKTHTFSRISTNQIELRIYELTYSTSDTQQGPISKEQKFIFTKQD